MLFYIVDDSNHISDVEESDANSDDDDDDDDDFKPVNPDKSSQPLQMLGIWACICVFT
jgi:hypothetical protein